MMNMSNVTSIADARKKRTGHSMPPPPTGTQQQVVFQRGDHVEIAAKLVDNLTRSGPAVYTDGEVYRYDDQDHVFTMVSQHSLRKAVHQYAGALVLSGDKPKPLKINAGVVSDVVTLTHDKLFRDAYFADATPGLTFANGFVSVTSDEVEVQEHSPEHKARFRYPFEFMPEAMPEKFLQFLEQVFQGDADAGDKVKILQEYVGTALIGQCTKYQRMLILVGAGSNGKSVLQRIAEAAMPTGSVSAIAPQAFRQDYRRALLTGKLLNIVSELPEADMLDSETFKAIVAGDPIAVRQIFGKPFTLRPIAGHLCCANRLPATTDHSHGFWRRMIVVPFNRTFTVEEQNANLAHELMREELPQIVSWFVTGARRVQLQGGYTIPQSHQTALAQWRNDADSVRAFTEERLVPVEDDEPLMLPSRAVYATYVQWCREGGHKPLAINRFGARMKLIKMGPRHTMNGSFYAVRFR